MTPAVIDVSFATFFRALVVGVLVWAWLTLWQWLLVFVLAAFIAVTLDPVVAWLDAAASADDCGASRGRGRSRSRRGLHRDLWRVAVGMTRPSWHHESGTSASGAFQRLPAGVRRRFAAASSRSRW